ncbi:MAG: hypothetical protein WC869_02040 [Phycisphaerae bacterium]
METANDRRLHKVLQAQSKLAKKLELKKAKVHALLVQQGLGSDPTYKAVVEDKTALKNRLHRHRLRMGRKRYGLRQRQKQINRIQTELALCQEQEQAMLASLDATDGKLQQLVAAAAAGVLASQALAGNAG